MKEVNKLLLNLAGWFLVIIFAGTTLWVLSKPMTVKTKDDTIVIVWNDGKEVSAKGKIKEYDDKVVIKVPGALLQKEDGTVEPVPAKTLEFYKHEIKAMIYLTK